MGDTATERNAVNRKVIGKYIDTMDAIGKATREVSQAMTSCRLGTHETARMDIGRAQHALNAAQAAVAELSAAMWTRPLPFVDHD